MFGWPSIHVRIRPRGTNTHQTLTNVPGAPRPLIRSGSSMDGMWSRAGGAGCFDCHHLSRVVHVYRQEIAHSRALHGMWVSSSVEAIDMDMFPHHSPRCRVHLRASSASAS